MVTLDGKANDGAPGENDFVAADIEEIDGPRWDESICCPELLGDVLTGNDDANTLSADGTLRGLGGPDELLGGEASDRLQGGPGADRLTSEQGNDSSSTAAPGTIVCTPPT